MFASFLQGGTPQAAHLTWINIGIGLLFLLLDALLSVTLQLGLSTSLLTAAARCVIQLTLMVNFLSTRFSLVFDIWVVARGSCSKRCSRQTTHGQWQGSLVRSSVRFLGDTRSLLYVSDEKSQGLLILLGTTEVGESLRSLYERFSSMSKGSVFVASSTSSIADAVLDVLGSLFA